MDNTRYAPNISICTGIGGLEKGMSRHIAGFANVAYVEIESVLIENLVQQMEKMEVAPAPIWTDIKTFRGNPFRGRI